MYTNGESQRYGSIDALKILGAILIVFLHYQGLTGAKFQGFNFAHGTLFFGYIVEFFFILSGMVCYNWQFKILNGYSFKKYITNKYSRLMPMVIISAAFYYPVVVVYHQVTGQFWETLIINSSDVLIDMLGLSYWFRSTCYVNPPSWYISVLLLCYIIFYGCVRLSKKYNFSQNILYLMMIFIGVGIMSYGISLPLFRNEIARGYIAFFEGLLLENLLQEKYLVRQKRWIYIISFFNIVLTIIFYFLYCSIYATTKDQYLYNDYSWIVYIAFPSIIILANSKVSREIFNHKIINLLGKVSFDVYIWHYQLVAVLMILNSLLNLNLDYNNPMNMYAFTFFVWLFSILSYFFIERKTLNYANEIYDKLFSFLLEYRVGIQEK